MWFTFLQPDKKLMQIDQQQLISIKQLLCNSQTHFFSVIDTKEFAIESYMKHKFIFMILTWVAEVAQAIYLHYMVARKW